MCELRTLLRVWRWLLNVECQEPFCHQRRICWRWHVETVRCPTCRHDVTEDDPRFAHVFRFAAIPALATGPPTYTSSNGVTYTMIYR